MEVFGLIYTLVWVWFIIVFTIFACGILKNICRVVLPCFQSPGYRFKSLAAVKGWCLRDSELVARVSAAAAASQCWIQPRASPPGGPGVDKGCGRGALIGCTEGPMYSSRGQAVVTVNFS